MQKLSIDGAQKVVLILNFLAYSAILLTAKWPRCTHMYNMYIQNVLSNLIFISLYSAAYRALYTFCTQVKDSSQKKKEKFIVLILLFQIKKI